VWSETHRPRSLNEMVGNGAARAKLVDWLKKWKKGKALLLVGPPGTGKTTSVHLAAKELGMDLVELNASDVRTKDKLSKKVGHATGSMSLLGGTTLIFLDEVDGLAGRADYGAIDFIRDMVRKSANPVVMAANDPESDEVRKLTAVTTKVEFKRADSGELFSHLAAIAAAEGVKADPGELEEFASAANGDIRSAINMLQGGIAAFKDEDLTASKAVNDFLGAMTREEALRALRAYPGQPREKVRDIFSSVLKSRVLDERKEKAFETLSKADVIMGRMMRGGDWRLLRYLDQTLAELLSDLGDGGAKYSPDSVPWPLLVRIWNDSRKHKELAQMVGKRLGIGARGALVEDLPYLYLLCRDVEFRAALVKGLGLEENYAAFVEKESARRR
jgi:replication factor C large subunit